MDLTSIKTIKNLCQEYNIRPSKKLGQNFLIGSKVLKKIVQAGELSKKDLVLEIGPGFGTLTQELIKRAGQVIVVEKDKRLAEFLSRQKNSENNLEIINGDVLKMKDEKLKMKNYKIISNLPYQITSPVLWKFLHEAGTRRGASLPELMVLTVQKEVAERIVAQPGQMNVLAVMCQFFTECKIVDFIKRENFWPMPEVDSAIIKLKAKNKKMKIGEINKLFRIVKLGFSSKRKMLKNNLSKGLKIPQVEIVESLIKVGLSEKVRAQELGIESWVKICKAI